LTFGDSYRLDFQLALVILGQKRRRSDHDTPNGEIRFISLANDRFARPDAVIRRSSVMEYSIEEI
jgi:hypothetical protein